MRKERQKAKEMREAGKSYTEISKKFGVPKSTLSSWFSQETWSQKVRTQRTSQAAQEAKVRARQLPKAVRRYWQGVHNQYRTEAIKDFLELSKQARFLAGIVLYWTRGDTSSANSQVRFTSNDHEMIRAFRSFLLTNELANEEQIKMRLILYPDLIDSVQKSTWAKLLGIPAALFQKSIIIKRAKTTKRFSSGSCMILIHSRKLKEKLLKWIEIYQGMLYNPKV
ncbi:MAG: hypothetical protein AAB483_01970 [Patescibacteria group bacterium]